MSTPRVICKFPVSAARRANSAQSSDSSVSSNLGPPSASKAARVLALAHRIEELVETGVVDDYASVARSLGLTRARLTQVMGLTLLAPSIQEKLLLGGLRTTERALRPVHALAHWDEQARQIESCQHCAIPGKR